MSKHNSSQNETDGQFFRDSFFDQLFARMDKQDAKLESILAQVQKTNGRVTKLEGEVFKSSIPWYSDKKLLYIAGVCLMVFLLIAAAVLGVRIPTL